MTLLSGNIFNTDNLAVPIPIVDPTDIFGIVETNRSVTIPAAVIAGVSNINFVLAKSGGRSVPNMELLRKHLLREGHINKPELIEIIAAAV